MIRLDKVKGSAHLASFTFATDLANGTVVTLGALASDGDAYVATAPVAVATDRMVIHATPELMYEADALEQEFLLKAGAKGRGYFIEKGDIITITDDEITGTTVVGQYVFPANAATKMVFSAIAPTTEKLAFMVIAKETLNSQAASVLEAIIA